VIDCGTWLIVSWSMENLEESLHTSHTHSNFFTRTSPLLLPNVRPTKPANANWCQMALLCHFDLLVRVVAMTWCRRRWLIVVSAVEVARRTPIRIFLLVPPLCFSQMSNQQSQPMPIGARWHCCAILIFSSMLLR
jgi:hypothetical protein